MENCQFTKKTAREEEKNKETTKLPEPSKVALVSSYLSIITLSGSGLNHPVKSHRAAGWIKK